MTVLGLMPMAVAGGGVGADPPAQQPPPCLPRGRPAGEGHQLRNPPHPPPQGRGWRLAPHGLAAGTRVATPRRAPGGNAKEGCVGVHPLELARLRFDAPDKAETEGAWVWRWDAVAGRAGADWATCLRLLERAAAVADIACDGAVLTAALLMRVGGVSLFRAAN